MKRKFLKIALPSLIMCLMLAATVLTGCAKNEDKSSSSTSNNGEQVSLTFFGYKADAMNLTATEKAMKDFMAKNKNIDITYEGIKGNDYETAFDKRLEAGELDDVVMMHHDHVVSMGEAGQLVDLSGLKGIENYSDVSKGQIVNEDGSIYTLPTSISTYNLYINTDLLKENGQEVPTNWAEFQQVCDYFANKGVTPIIANNRNSLSTLILSKGLFDVYQQSEEDLAKTLKSYNENPALFAEALAPGVEQVADMLKRGWFDPEVALKTGQTSDDLELFLKGENPFMITGGWASTRVMSKNPSFSYGVYPYPILDDGSVLSLQVDTCISINADSDNVEAAKSFVEYLIQPDVMWEYCDSQASYTPLKTENRTPSEATLAPSIDYLNNGRVALRAEYRLDLPMEAALKKCSDVLLKGGSAAEAQKALLQELNK